MRRGAVTIPVTCTGAECAGAITLLRAAGAASASTAKKVSYGSARFKVAAGKQANVRVKLNARGRALLRKRRSAKVTARVTFTAGGGVAKSFRITLKR